MDWVPFTPADIARKMLNMVRGDWMMGEISLDNMLCLLYTSPSPRD